MGIVVSKEVIVKDKDLKGWLDRITELEQENKSLREQLIQRNMQNDNLGRKNKELKEERDFFKEQATLWRNDYKNEYEENRNLKSELSKFSEAYKKYRDYEKEELAESCYDLARENEKLKADTEHTVKFNNKIIGELKLENEKLKEEIGKLVMNGK